MKRIISLFLALFVLFSLAACGTGNKETDGESATSSTVDGSDNLTDGSDNPTDGQEKDPIDEAPSDDSADISKEPVPVPLAWYHPFLHDHPNVETCDGKECLQIQIVRDAETAQSYLDTMMERTAEAIITVKDFISEEIEWSEKHILAQMLVHYKRSVIALGHCDEAYFEDHDLILISTCNPNYGYDRAEITAQVIEDEGNTKLFVDIFFEYLEFPDTRMPIIIAVFVDKSYGIESAEDVVLKD